MADKEFTYSDVSEHATKKDLYLVIHDKVYNTSSFVDEHPYVSAYCPLPHSIVPFPTFPPPLSQWASKNPPRWIRDSEC
jgi:hypothetical protein